MKDLLTQLWQQEEGQDLVEYSLLFALIALIAVCSMNKLANRVGNVLSAAAANLTTS